MTHHHDHDHDQHDHLDPDAQPGGGRELPWAADSHGFSWAGRELSASGFEDDRGDADPAVRAAATAVLTAPTVQAEVDLMVQVAGARWLVPIVAVPVDTQIHQGMRVEGHAEMAAVTLTGRDGESALPVFSGLDSLMVWDPDARPVPVTAERAAQAAVSEGCSTILLDLGSEYAVALRPSMVWALASGRAWQPSHLDPFVATSVERALAQEKRVVGHRLGPARPMGSGGLQITLTLAPGLTHDDVAAMATRIGERLATDGEFRARVDAVSFTIEAAQA